MLGVMLVECSHCGAPLDVRDHSRLVKCSYCDHTNRVRSMHTIAVKAPPDWTPPPQWTPPPSKRRPAPQPLRYHETRPPRRGLLAGFTVLLTLIGVMVPLAFSVVPALQSTGLLARLTGLIGLAGLERAVGIATWDGVSPFQCGGNENVVIENVTAALPRDTAVTVGGNCDLRIVGSTITARGGVHAGGNGRVVIENSRIDATGVAIRAGGNKRIEIIDSQVTAGDTAIEAGGSVEVSLVGGRVSGKPVLSLSGHARLDNQQAELIDLTPPAAPKARPGRSKASEERRRARRERRQAE